MSKFREEIETIRMRLILRIEQLHQHEEEYKEDKEFDNASRCHVKSASLLMVVNELDKALKIED